MADKKIQQGQLNIELPEDIAEGQYSNLAVISHNHSEFVVDFIMMAPNVPKAKVKAPKGPGGHLREEALLRSQKASAR